MNWDPALLNHPAIGPWYVVMAQLAGSLMICATYVLIVAFMASTIIPTSELAALAFNYNEQKASWPMKIFMSAIVLPLTCYVIWAGMLVCAVAVLASYPDRR